MMDHDHEQFIDRNIIVPGSVPSATKAMLKSSTVGYCTTCVSRNRRTKQLTSSKLLEIYNLLLPGRESLSQLTKVCWECEALLLKCLRFRSRAEHAQYILTHGLSQAKSATAQTLSTLTKKTITSHIEPDHQELESLGSLCQSTDQDINNTSCDMFLNNVSMKNEEAYETIEVSIDPFENRLDIKNEPDNEIETDRAPAPIVVAGKPIPVTVIKQVEMKTPLATQKRFVQLVSNEREKVPTLNLKDLKLLEPSSHGLNTTRGTPLTLKNVFATLPNSTHQSGKLNRTGGGAKLIQLQNSPNRSTLISQFRHGAKLPEKIPVTLLRMKARENQTSNQTGAILRNKILMNHAGTILTSKPLVNQTGAMLGTSSPVKKDGNVDEVSKSNECSTVMRTAAESRLAQLSKLLMQKKLEQKNKNLQSTLMKSDHVIVSSEEDTVTEAEKTSVAVLKKGNEALQPCTPVHIADAGVSSVKLTQQEAGDDTIYECADCDYRGNRRDTYQHIKMQHKNLIMSDRPYSSLRCGECGKTFTCRSSMYRHRHVVHKLKGAGLRCDVCSNTYTDNYALKKHKRRIHSGVRTSLECPQCHRMYSGEESLRVHMRTHNDTPQPVRCDKCDIVYPSQFLYMQHVRGSVRHIGETQHRFECDTCGKTFYYKYTMKLHIQRQHMRIRRPGHVCGQCDKVLSTKRNLQLHVMYVHEKVEKALTKVCEICGKAFSSKELLKEHMVIHSGLRPYACAVCGDTFKARSALHMHKRLKHLKLKKPQYKKKDDRVTQRAETQEAE